MKKEIMKSIILVLKKKGAQLIKSKAKEDDSPMSYAFKGSKKSFTPDIVAEYGNKQDFFSIEGRFKKDELPDLITKWILFGASARNKGGKLYLVVRKNGAAKFEQIIAEKSISAHLIII